MKYFIFLIICFTFTMNAFAEEKSTAVEAVSQVYNDGKEAITTVYSDVKDLSKEIFPDLKDAISSIAKGVGVAAEHVYKVLTRKYIIEGVSYLIRFIGATLLIIISVLQLLKIQTVEGSCVKIFLYVVLLLMGLIGIITVPFNQMLSDLINPEYEVLNYILEYARSLV